MLAAFLTAVAVAAPAAGLEPFVPNDPYFFTNNPEGFPGQWYLDKQTSGAVVDINVRGAWERGLTGQGVVIGFIDSGIEYTHPDLAPNYRADLSWNFETNTADPIPSESHGTAVAGLAVARGGNGIGVTGVAPYAEFASLRLWWPYYVDNSSQIQADAAAQRLHSTGPDPQIHIKNLSYGENYGLAALRYPEIYTIEQAIRDSTAAGTIHVTIAQNQRLEHGVQYGIDGDANRKTVARMPEVITVAALNYQGTFAEYSNWGSCVTATVPSGETIWRGGVNLTTTDQTGTDGYNNHYNLGDTFPDRDYTSIFTGTSSAAPIMSGVLALAKQANPALDTRMAKHLLAQTSVMVDPLDSTPMGGWTTNAAGYHFNNNYGFGLVDADALTLAATQYSGVTPLVTNTTGRNKVGTYLPINDPVGISQTATIDWNDPLEEVLVRLTINEFDQWWKLGPHWYGRYYGKLQLELTSPSGTHSLLAFENPNAFRFDSFDSTNQSFDWTFTSNAFWGEDPSGDWIVALSHPLPSSGSFDSQYRWDSFELITRSGSLVPLAGTGEGIVVYWSGDGSWNATNDNWGIEPGVYSGTAWRNDPRDHAVFEGTGGTVTLAEPVTAGAITFNAPGYTMTGGTLTLTESATVTTNDVDARIESVIDGSDGLTKAGSGILELTGANIYVGGTVINGGTLLVNNTEGSGTGEGTVTVNHGGILGGSGSMLGAMIVAQGGVVAPGNSPGTLFGTDALFEGGGGYQFEVNQAEGTAGYDPGWDLLALSGTLTIEATSANPFVIDVTSLALDNTAGVVWDFDPFQGYVWTLVTAAEGIFGFDPSAFFVNTENFANDLMGGTFFVTADANNLHLQFNPVPEPSSATALLGMGLVGALLRRRKRRRGGRTR